MPSKSKLIYFCPPNFRTISFKYKYLNCYNQEAYATQVRRLHQDLEESKSLSTELRRQAIQKDRQMTRLNQDMTASKIKIEHIERHLEQGNQRELAQDGEIAKLKREARERERAHKRELEQLKSDATVRVRSAISAAKRDAQEREKEFREQLESLRKENSQSQSSQSARLEVMGKLI